MIVLIEEAEAGLWVKKLEEGRLRRFKYFWGSQASRDILGHISRLSTDLIRASFFPTSQQMKKKGKSHEND